MISTWNFVFPSSSKEDQQKSIFTRCDKHGYRLKDNVQFHLYISTSPCGDARIFSPHEAGVEGTRTREHGSSRALFSIHPSTHHTSLSFTHTAH